LNVINLGRTRSVNLLLVIVHIDLTIKYINNKNKHAHHQCFDRFSDS